MMKSSPLLIRLCLKLFMISLLVSFSYSAAAEYYLVTGTDPFALCDFCTKHKKSRHKHHSHKKIVHYRHHYRSPYGLFVYRPVPCPCNDVYTLGYCACCPSSTNPRTVGGDYVIFNNNPAREPKNWQQKAENRYSADLTTGDDVMPELELD